MPSWSPQTTYRVVAGASVPSASVFWNSSPFLVWIPPVRLQFLFRSLLGSFPVWPEEGSCLHVRQEQLFCNLHTATFLGKSDERGERPFPWPLTSLLDHHTYSVHSIQYWLCDLLSDIWHEQPLNEVVDALAPNIRVHFLSLLHHGFPSSSWYKSSQYPFHLSAICVASVKFLPVADWIHYRLG